MNLKSLSNSVLVSELKSKVLDERKLLNKILELLYEVGRRQLYLDMAYPSLFEFCVGELGYGEAAAYRRIEAMRLLKGFSPEVQTQVKEKIEAGSLNLTHLASTQSFFKKEAKINNKTYTSQERIEILENLSGTSKRETEVELVKLSPQISMEKKESIKLLNENEAEFKAIIPIALLKALEDLRAIRSHQNPNMTMVELIEILAKEDLKKHSSQRNVSSPAEPKHRQSMENFSSKNFPQPSRFEMRSRYIPINVKRQVWQRDQGKCTYVNKQTGKVCEAKHLIQFDHIQEFAKGGTSLDPNNIRLLCGAHNRYRNQQVFRI